MKLVIAPDSFKEALLAREAGEAIARGIRRVRGDAVIDVMPMADGGEGTVDALVAATGGTLRHVRVTGPLGEPVEATWGTLGDDTGTAVIEMSSASGLALVPPDQRNPMKTTTLGTGQLIRAALDTGASDILLGIGGSATNDGGTGAAQAIGVGFLDDCERPLPDGLTGGLLPRIARIDLSGCDSRLNNTTIKVACDVDNPLCGPNGAATVYGPQKGASPEQVEQLDRNLSHLADLIQRDLDKQVRDVPGAGAAGGLGAGLIAFFNAELQAGIRLVMNALAFEQRIADADLVITGEGRLDRQSVMGKVIAGVGQACRSAGVPVVAIVGAAGDGAEQTLNVLDDYLAITPPELPLAEALPRTAELLETAAVSFFQKWLTTRNT